MGLKVFFQNFDPDMSVDALRPIDTLGHFQTQMERRSGNAANKDRKNFLAAWEWGMKYLDPPLPAPNPFAVEKMPEERHPRYIPPQEDLDRVYETARGQDQLMLMAYIHLAARRQEVFRLRWEDVDFPGGRIRLFTRKRQNGTYEFDWLPMTQELHQALQEHMEESNSEWVFPNPETEKAYYERKRWMKGLCREAGVKHFGLHAIRYLSASVLAEKGVPSLHVKDILRHKKLSTTERYLRRLGDLKTSVEMLSKKKKPSGEPSRHLEGQNR